MAAVDCMGWIKAPIIIFILLALPVCWAAYTHGRNSPGRIYAKAAYDEGVEKAHEEMRAHLEEIRGQIDTTEQDGQMVSNWIRTWSGPNGQLGG